MTRLFEDRPSKLFQVTSWKAHTAIRLNHHLRLYEIFLSKKGRSTAAYPSRSALMGLHLPRQPFSVLLASCQHSVHPLSQAFVFSCCDFVRVVQASSPFKFSVVLACFWRRWGHVGKKQQQGRMCKHKTHRSRPVDLLYHHGRLLPPRTRNTIPGS